MPSSDILTSSGGRPEHLGVPLHHSVNSTLQDLIDYCVTFPKEVNLTPSAKSRAPECDGGITVTITHHGFKVCYVQKTADRSVCAEKDAVVPKRYYWPLFYRVTGPGGRVVIESMPVALTTNFVDGGWQMGGIEVRAFVRATQVVLSDHESIQTLRRCAKTTTCSGR